MASNPSNGTSSPPRKKQKMDFNYVDNSLIDEMDGMEQDELMNATDRPHPPSPPTPISSSKSPMAIKSETRRDWLRPPPLPIDPAKDVVSFQQLDIDDYIGDHIPGMPGLLNSPSPVLRMYGITMEGNSVCAHLHGFMPYLYIPLPHSDFKEEHCGLFRASLNEAVLDDMRSNRDNVKTAIVSVEICQKCSIYGFHFNKMYPFLKITVSTPRLIASTRRIVGSVQIAPFHTTCGQTYESNIEYEIRFMVDSGVVGCNWIDCPPGMYVYYVKWLRLHIGLVCSSPFQSTLRCLKYLIWNVTFITTEIVVATHPVTFRASPE